MDNNNNKPPKPEPSYCGDGVYVKLDQFEFDLVLTTGSHLVSEAASVIIFSPRVFQTLLRWIKENDLKQFQLPS